MRLIEIPDDGIVREFIWRGDSVVGERRVDLSYLPTIEAEPVRHGRWSLAEDGDGVVCSCCGKDFCNLVYETDDFNYCPNCGAKMDKEAEKNDAEQNMAHNGT